MLKHGCLNQSPVDYSKKTLVCAADLFLTDWSHAI